MKKLKDIFFSMYTTVTMLAIFAFSIGLATFIESHSGTPRARELVYNAQWFEILLFLLVINLIGTIFKRRLISRKKWTILLFHCAFICILIGSAVTRYFGYEGILHLRNGQTSNEISIEKTAVKIKATYEGKTVSKNIPVKFSATSSNQFSEDLDINGKKVHFENQLFVPNAIETLEDNAPNGEPAVDIFLMSGAESSHDFTLLSDNPENVSGVTFGFEPKEMNTDITFSVKNSELYFKSKNKLTKTGTLASGMIDRAHAKEITPGTLIKGKENTVYRTGKVVFMIRGFYPKVVRTLTPASSFSDNEGMGDVGHDALIMQVNVDGKSKQINVLSNGNEAPIPSECKIDGVDIAVSYGEMQKALPFSITLKRFILTRYPGSMSPSSYASQITVTDNQMRTVMPYRIYMNHILNYRGYRFFQSSYDKDELGTILSVNHDYWGTLISYLGYFLLFLGMITTLFNKNSRFQTVMRLTAQIQEKRKSTLSIIAALLLVTSALNAQDIVTKDQHIKSLESLLVQDGVKGRIEPLASYASDLLRKINKHNTYKGKSATEVILDMTINSSRWKNEPMIKVDNPKLEKELGTVNGYVSFNQLFDSQSNYKINDQVQKAYQKPASARSKYDREIINLDERLNICYNIFTQNQLAIFPDPNNPNGKWMKSLSDMQSVSGVSGSVCPYLASGGSMSQVNIPMHSGTTTDSIDGEGMIGSGTPLPGHCTRNDLKANFAMTGDSAVTNTPNLLNAYITAVDESMSSGNWAVANQKLSNIKKYQMENGGSNLPSQGKIQMEINYSKWNIFIKLMIAYFIAGFFLLLMHFFYIFNPKSWVERIIRYATYPLGLLFIIYTFGLLMRWYISGHAPWSNGYESMIFVGWGASLAGFIFARKSAIAFSVTALLSAIALGVAAMSWMNPEITNLVPVLKSYWLLIHVAIITSSYGFLAMGFILGFLNLILIIARNNKNGVRIDSHIREISYLIEMGLTIGLFMLTVGTFIGGVWANESWGRYWGWDAKETWALVSVLVYAIILHLRLIPKLNNPFVLSTAAFVGFCSIIMTFLGVNYYLAGMHSYAKGTAPPVPPEAFIVIPLIILFIYAAYRSNEKFNQKEVRSKK